MNAILQQPILPSSTDSLHPWSRELLQILAAGCVSEEVASRVVSEFELAISNDAPTPVSVAALLSLGAVIRTKDAGFTATVVLAGQPDLRGEGLTIEEAVLDVYARHRRYRGHATADRIDRVLADAHIEPSTRASVSLIICRLVQRYSLSVPGSGMRRTAVSACACPSCDVGAMVAVRYSDTVVDEAGTVAVHGLERDYCPRCGTTSVGAGAAKRNQLRIEKAGRRLWD